MTSPAAPLKPFAAIVFDMDGTLLDTEAVFRAIVFDVSAGLAVSGVSISMRTILGSGFVRVPCTATAAFSVAVNGIPDLEISSVAAISEAQHASNEPSTTATVSPANTSWPGRN